MQPSGYRLPGQSDDPKSFGWLILSGVAMLCLFTAKCGGNIATGANMVGPSHRAPKLIDPNSEEGKRALKIKADYEAMRRAELR